MAAMLSSRLVDQTRARNGSIHVRHNGIVPVAEAKGGWVPGRGASPAPATGVNHPRRTKVGPSWTACLLTQGGAWAADTALGERRRAPAHLLKNCVPRAMPPQLGISYSKQLSYFLPYKRLLCVCDCER